MPGQLPSFPLDRKKTLRNLVAILLATGVAACNDGGGGGGGGDDTATVKDNDTWLATGLGIDNDSTWFMYINSTVNGDVMEATLERISDQGPPEGTTLDVDYTEDDDNVMTFKSDQATLDAVGRLNTAGNTYLNRDKDLTDGSGALQVGIKGGQGTDDATLSGDYWVAMVHSDTADYPNYFTGTYDMNFDGQGTLAVTNGVNDQGFNDYVDLTSYAIASSGKLTVTHSPRDLVGAARGDGELFNLVETRGDKDNSDNSYKTLFVGVETSSNATDALLEGTWDLASTCSDYNNSGWWEGASTMTLDDNGDGTFQDEGASSSGDISIELNNDGTFELGNMMEGAVTPSGDTMVLTYTAVEPDDGDYCLSVGIKHP